MSEKIDFAGSTSDLLHFVFSLGYGLCSNFVSISCKFLSACVNDDLELCVESRLGGCVKDAACSGDDRGTVDIESNQRGMPVGELTQTASSHLVFQGRMAQKVRLLFICFIISFLAFFSFALSNNGLCLLIDE